MARHVGTMEAMAPGQGRPPARGSALGAEPSAEVSASDPLYRLRVGEVWQWLTQQPISFWLVCAYTMFEYVRPQQIYTGLDVIPWSKILLVLAPVAFVLEGNRFRAGNPIDWAVGFFSVVLLLSSVFAFDPSESWKWMTVYVNWVLAYILIRGVVNTERRFLFFMVMFLLYSFKMGQHGTRTWVANGFAFSSWGASGAPGWFQNSGEFGIQMCIFLPLALYFFLALRKHWSPLKTAFFLALPASAVASIIASSSRGSQLGLAAVGLWLVLRSRYKVRGALGLAVAASLVFTLLPDEQRQRFTESGTDRTSETRLTYWRHGIEMAREHPVLGVGYRNWLPYSSQRWERGGGAQLQELPHNIFVEAGAELGYTGLGALLLLIGAHFLVNWRSRKLLRPLGDQGRLLTFMALGLDAALIGFMVSGFFVTVLYYPFLWFNLAMTSALHAAAVAKAKATSVQATGPAGTPMVRRGMPGWRAAMSSARSLAS